VDVTGFRAVLNATFDDGKSAAVLEIARRFIVTVGVVDTVNIWRQSAG